MVLTEEDLNNPDFLASIHKANYAFQGSIYCSNLNSIRLSTLISICDSIRDDHRFNCIFTSVRRSIKNRLNIQLTDMTH